MNPQQALHDLAQIAWRHDEPQKVQEMVDVIHEAITEQDEQEGMVLSKIVIEHVMTDEMSGVSVTASDSEGNIPPLLEMLGMVEMARDTVYAIASGEHDED